MYNWIISSVDVHTSQNDLTNVIYHVHWRMQKDYTLNGETQVADIYGSKEIADPDPANFTPFDDVTNAMVIGWLEDAFTAEEITDFHTALDNQINEAQNPTTLNLTIEN